MTKRKSVSQNSLNNLKKANPQNNFNNSEVARAAQQKSVASRKKRKTLAELMKIALTLPNAETGEENGVAITNAMIMKAISGDVNAYQTIRDTIGEKPVDVQKIATNQPAIMSECSEKKIEEVLRRIKDSTYE